MSTLDSKTTEDGTTTASADAAATGTPSKNLATDVGALYSSDMSALPAFVGPFINFGYWDANRASARGEPPADAPVPTLAERQASSRALYERVFEALDPRGAVAEVGCGLGAGCRALAAQHEPHVLTSVTGIDLSTDQLARAKALCSATDARLGFAQGPAERLPLGDASVDRIYTVEALQHFDSPSAFVTEAARCLAPGGRLVVCTFLADRALTAQEHDVIASGVRTVAVGIDKLVVVGDLQAQMRAAGLSVQSPARVGDRVWDAFGAWCALAQPTWTWPAAWLRAYHAGWVDYFIVVADKPCAGPTTPP
ncbi:methyltransferase type 11 [Pandoravirus inopinatum]|uniref:Methyltransferase type 11 n=1 Tax=Pandoravirus inopinatum TaxID=1605721 RepID=A0A0B5J146_9VIRU|nr:methyltransferase type 11 [Pandoravirus inopinatum]AJF97164.1 methyltransferase type 11 [Pandoravirus inopinatum]